MRLISLSIALAASCLASGQILADSVADFSGSQGFKGWEYGYYDKTSDGGASAVYNHATDFKLFPQFVPTHGLNAFASGSAWIISESSGSFRYTRLWANGGHGNGIVTTQPPSSPVEHFAVRRWVSNFTGTVKITVTHAKLDSSSTSNGTAFRVRRNSADLFSSGGSYNSTAAYTKFGIHTLAAGDAVDLFLDSWQANDLGDSTRLEMRIEVVPEPLTILTLGFGAAFLARRRR